MFDQSPLTRECTITTTPCRKSAPRSTAAVPSPPCSPCSALAPACGGCRLRRPDGSRCGIGSCRRPRPGPRAGPCCSERARSARTCKIDNRGGKSLSLSSLKHQEEGPAAYSIPVARTECECLHLFCTMTAATETKWLERWQALGDVLRKRRQGAAPNTSVQEKETHASAKTGNADWAKSNTSLLLEIIGASPQK